MAFYKQMNSGSIFSVMNNGDESSLFPVGFSYMVADIIYTVTKRFVSDNTEFRRLQTTDGVTEDVNIHTILTDLRSSKSNVKILHDPNHPVVEEKPVEEKPESLPIKKASVKKNAKKKKNKKK